MTTAASRSVTSASTRRSFPSSRTGTTPCGQGRHSPPCPSIPTVTLQFAVRGPRFTLNPADISSYFPPPSPPTPFEGQLPHVVVARKTLPWERLLGPGPDYQGVPWLGLLVVDEDDHDGIPKVQSGTVADLLSDG